ncbi:MAG: spore coat associated protein CotJA [Peptococcaceae bacterium]|nr:spore coat associated protein CotJA [Peptococcaceae bacterium]
MYSQESEPVLVNLDQSVDAGEMSPPSHRQNYQNPMCHQDHLGVPHMGHLTLARSYVVYQQLGSVYCPADAHKHGTLFPELVRPYP